MTTTIHHGDCLDVLRAMPDNSVDAVVCDPPYGLSNTTPDKVTDTIVRWAQGDREHVPTGKGFMSQTWDAFVPPVAVWDECLRVLKPGGHLVAFAGSRTQDLMGLSIRLAGFDLRDSIAWINGAGFPKSHDISKAIDKMAPRVGMFDDFATHYEERRKASGMTHGQVCELGKFYANVNHGGASVNWGKGHNVPTRAQWDILAPALGLSDEWLPLIERVEAEREVVGIRSVPQGHAFAGSTYGGDSTSRDYNDTVASTSDAEKWKGWGTSLKPAVEPVIVARKPLGGKTVAANVLEWGTGGLNIDATRIAHGADVNLEAKQRQGSSSGLMHGVRDDTYGTGHEQSMYAPGGRWPANVVLDNETAPALDEQSGGASRFFKVVEPDPPFLYAAKAPKKERPVYTDENGNTIQHSTVKPLSVISWLVKLCCPTGGTVLDPFAGSGTTIEAAITNGFNVIGIEREAAYLPLIQQRIDRATPPSPEPAEADLLDLLGDAA